MKIYILTSEFNDYDQYGEYFIKAFRDKPSVDYLIGYLNINEHVATHILNGGGRLDKEYMWYFLREVEL